MPRTRTPRFAFALAAVAVGLATTFAAAPAHAETWTFHQGGFHEGAFVSGTFSATDTDHDGWILGYEIADFALSFSGNSLVGAFRHAYDNGSGFGNWAYKIGSGNLDDLHYGGPWTLGGYGENDFGSVRYAFAAWEAEGLDGGAGVFDTDTGAASLTTQRMHVTAVPEPASWALLLAGVAAVGGLARRRA
jgi:hypothetical protein